MRTKRRWEDGKEGSSGWFIQGYPLKITPSRSKEAKLCELCYVVHHMYVMLCYMC